MRKSNFLIFILFLVSSGCTTFHHKPIETAASYPDIGTITNITPKQAAKLSLTYNPNLEIDRAENSMKRSLLISAGLFSNPQISGDIQIPSGGNTSGTSNGYDLGISWGINKLFTSSIYRKAANARIKQLELSLAWKEWLVEEKTKLTAYKLIILKKQIEIAKVFKNLLHEYVQQSNNNISSGLISFGAYYKLEQNYLNITSFLSNLESKYIKNKALLKELIGYPAERKLSLSDKSGIPQNIILPKRSYLIKSIAKNRPDIIAMKDAYKSNEYMLKAAIIGQFPNIVIGFTNSRDNSDLYTIVPGISVSIPIFNHNQAKIASLRAKRIKLSKEYAYRLYNSKMNINRITKLLKENKRLTYSVIKDKNRVESMVQKYRQALNAGDCDIYGFLNIENVLVQKKIKLLSLRENYLTLLSALELETGRMFFR